MADPSRNGPDHARTPAAPAGAGAVAMAPPAALPHRRVLVVIGALMLGLLLAALDQTIVATALPTIVADLHGASHISWVITSYILAATASTPLWGKLGDQYGRRRFFQASIVIFLAGSVLSGLSANMLELIVFRAIQGLGGGGLMVGAQAIVGDIVPPRDRGRYQGLFGAVFGAASIVGPLLGGVIVENLSWRWIFYINVPIGAVALVVIAATVPGALSKVQHVIDYAGTITLTLAASALVLFTSLGGTTYPWSSAPIIGLGVGGAVLVVVFALIERRAAEPILPLKLFRNRTFASTSAAGFVVGFSMFGAITFLPLFFQVVKGASPTGSGLALLPLMGGMLTISIISGQIISRTGRYRAFPIVGTVVMSFAVYLLSLMSPTSGYGVEALYMVLLGMGLGAVMQVLVIIVQNAVPWSELGAATAGATFFRSIGGSFGTAVFGAIFSNVLVGNLARHLSGATIPPGFSSSSVTPALLQHLPPAIHSGLVAGYAESIQTVFVIAAPITAIAFVATLFIPHVELRRGIGEATPAPGGGAVATPADAPAAGVAAGATPVEAAPALAGAAGDRSSAPGDED